MKYVGSGRTWACLEGRGRGLRRRRRELGIDRLILRLREFGYFNLLKRWRDYYITKYPSFNPVPS